MSWTRWWPPCTPHASVMFPPSRPRHYILADRCRSLTTDSIDADWRAALGAAEQVCASGQVAVQLHGKPARKLLGVVTKVASDLRECAASPEVPDLSQLDPQEAFERGREMERAHQRVARARASFVERWPERVTRIRRLLAKVRR